MKRAIILSLAVLAACSNGAEKPEEHPGIRTPPDRQLGTWKDCEVKDSVHEPYLDEVQDKIDRAWFYPPAAGPLGLEGTAVFVASYDTQGQIVALVIERSAGASIFDDATVEILRRSTPWPAPPAKYITPVRVRGCMVFCPKATQSECRAQGRTKFQ